ncbi:integrin alpha-PS1-like isoform X2 [Tigriopus californicus]|nr:integrin alpha-PS1-like isoform X2 [Tigriopus californicus]XP_059094880.1 integrin alpha-PS1-like isoform X2 [Tigriopus californicus]
MDKTYGIYNGSLNTLNPPISSELKDGQWLGVEVQSQGEGGKVIVCAHRYAVRDVEKHSQRVQDTKRGMLGMCYVLDPDLTLPRNDDIGYKNIVNVRDAVGGKHLEPKRDTFDNHAQWGVCQLGTAASFVKDEDLSDNDQDLALFGAPGCFTWRGNVFGQNLGTHRRYRVAVDFENMLDFSKHGHMGLSVTSGRFFNGDVYYVSGAPHAGQDGSRTGEVYFFRKDPIMTRYAPDWSYTLKGEVFGTGYGYSLATLDANGDSSPDLLVGAPFYDGGKEERGGAVYLYLSKGRALHSDYYVKILGKQVESQFGLALTNLGDLNHDGFEDFAVGSPYEDDGKGAVYVFFGGQRGLRAHGPPLKGSPPFLYAEEVADQIITAGDLIKAVPNGVLPLDLRTLGSSLSGGMDMDANGYPDLLIGAYQSSHVFLLRSRPIIDIRTSVNDENLKGIDPGQAGCREDETSEDACFSFNACFSVDKEVSKQGLSLTFKIEAEPKKPVSRVWLRLLDRPDVGPNRTNIVTDTIKIEGRRAQCTAVIGYIGPYADLQSPVQFAMSYSLVQAQPRMLYLPGASLPNINDYPILNQAQAKKRFQATFEKDCGEDDVCQSQLAFEPTLRDESKELGRTPGGYYELELGSLKRDELTLDVTIKNGGDPAYEATFDVFFPPSVSYIGMGKDTKLNAPEFKNETWLSFNLGNPFKGAANGEAHSTNIQLRFSPRLLIDDKLIQFYLTANTSSTQVYDTSTFVNLVVVRRAEVKVVGGGFPEEVHYGGTVRGESALQELAEIGPQVVHKFLVINNGPSAVDVLTVHIAWPFQVENGKAQGKWLLYLTDHPSLRNGRGDCVLPSGFAANPLNYTAGHDGITARHTLGHTPPANFVMKPGNGSDYEDFFQSSAARDSSLGDPDLKAMMQKLKSKQKREVEQVILPRVLPGLGPNGGDLKVVTLDCDRGTAKCLRITCQIYNMPAGVPATIEVRSRLWNSTLVEDYSGIDQVEIFSKAKVTVDPDITQNIGDDYVSVRTIAYPDSHQLLPEQGLEWWIILISILVGLLVLVLICLILWKLGFFKRKRPSEEDDVDFMMSAHFEKAHLNGNS